MRSPSPRRPVAVPAAVPAAALAVLLLGAAPASAEGVSDVPLASERIATGLVRPLCLAAPPADRTRLFVVEQHPGRVRVIDLATDTLSPRPFLELTGLATGGDQGLLGLAFHPDFATNGRFYVNCVRETGERDTTFVESYTVSALDPEVADPASRAVVLGIEQPFFDHNGGWISFGPDGYLYVATGDGGGPGDPDGRAQDVTDELLGKILRLDVDRDDFPADPLRGYGIPHDNPFVGFAGDDEIWHWGLRNPWRASFDRATGDLWIGDVGWETREEVDVAPAGLGGLNFGWRCREGTHCSDGSCCSFPGTAQPLFEYEHGGTPHRCSVTGGVVYRGTAIPGLDGQYFFADYCAHRIWTLSRRPGLPVQAIDRTPDLLPSEGALGSVVAFGEDAAGEVYFTNLHSGDVFRIVPGPTPPGVVTCRGEGCPCGNDDPTQGCVNSTGWGALLFGCGSASVAADDLELRATGLPPGVSALVFMGDGESAAPLFAGLRCPSGTTWRFDCCPLVSSALGTLAIGPGFGAVAGGLLQPGTQWTFQAWYRDASGPCSAAANLTNGYRVAFVP